MPQKTLKLSAFLPYQLSITSNAVSDLIARAYRGKFALKVPEWRVMAILGDRASATQRDLVRATLMDKVAVNRACSVLSARGLVSRRPCERDGRSHHLALTSTGKAMHAEIMPLTMDMERTIFSCLTAREREMLDNTLSKLFNQVVSHTCNRARALHDA